MRGLFNLIGKRGLSLPASFILIVLFTVSFAFQAKAGIDFIDGFESGTYTPTWTAGPGAYTRAVTSSTAALGTYSYTQTGGTFAHFDGISTTFPNITPTYIGFYVRTNYLTLAGEGTAYFVIGGAGMTNGTIFFLFAEGEIRVYYGLAYESAGPYAVNTWYHIEFKNINWAAKTFDFYVDGTLIAASIPFWEDATSFTQIHLYNFTNSQAWYDAIVLADTGTNKAAYIRGASAPWGSTSNETAMDLAFPDGWDDLRMADGPDPFLSDSGYNTIFMEGSDLTALKLDAFLTANRTAIENWVSDGGRLLLNAAPNEGGNINFGFSGVTLYYSGTTTTRVNDVTASDINHPVFNGPNIPITDTFSGSKFAHAYLTGGGLTPIIIGAPGDLNEGAVVLGEKAYGSGRVLMGGMTTDNWHDPQPEAANLRANILRYVRGDIIINPGFETADFSGWIESTTGGGWLGIMSGMTTPNTGHPFSAPTEGTYAAVYDPAFIGNGILYQNIYVPRGYTSVSFSADIYVENKAIDYYDGSGFDSGVTNQKARFDIIDPTFPIDDIGAGVLANLFITNAGDGNSISPIKINMDLTPYAGQTVRVRLGVVATVGPLLVGLDNIQITVQSSDDGGGDGGSDGGGSGGGCFISTISY